MPDNSYEHMGAARPHTPRQGMMPCTPLVGLAPALPEPIRQTRGSGGTQFPRRGTGQRPDFFHAAKESL